MDSNGVQIGSAVTLIAFDKILWGANFQTTAGSADSLLKITAQTATLSGHVFPSSWPGGECAVRLDTAGALTMSGASGTVLGDANDCDSSNGLGGVTGTSVVTWNGQRIPRHSGSSGYPSIASDRPPPERPRNISR